MTVPDFIVIGAMKCGTTTLAAQLGAQEGVFMTKPKEPFYFSDDEVYAKGPEWYSQLFARAAATDLRGEASTKYTMLPTHPDTVARMRAAISAPRLVYMIRDPVQRCLSHYKHEWIERRISTDIGRAIERHAELIDYGRYAMQIAPFVEAYGREAILISSLEQMNADPSGELARIGAHIGMTRPAVWKDDMKAQNVSAKRSRKLPFHRVLVSNPMATKLRDTLVPVWLDRRVRQARAPRAHPVLPEAAKERIMSIHRTEHDALLKMRIPGAEAALAAIMRS